jgi:hypothetical protein
VQPQLSATVRVLIERIVSGGQTGADRAALDWAMTHGVPHGGWCPARRLAEDGAIAPQYRLTEVPDGGGYRQRTKANVRDSDATGWVKPVAKPTPETLRARIAELAEAESQLREMEEGTRLEALVKVSNLMRAFELTPVDLGLVPAPKRRGRPRKTDTGQEQLRLPAI